MAKANSTRKTLIPAVGYLRRSTSKQEKSLKDQKAEIIRYAKQHGYKIVRWYTDDGISGDDTLKRRGFLDMHHTACNGRDFDVILCWKEDRFGRFDSLEAGHWIHPLRQAGVRLETVVEGPVNWDDFAGRVINCIRAEGNHEFLKSLSQNVLRGQTSNAEKGRLNGQVANYGYDRALVDESGTIQQVVPFGQKVAKPKSWHVVLVPSQDREAVKTVRWIFRTYANTDIGLRGLATTLNEKGIPSPRGKKWSMTTIHGILKNRAYVGDRVWNQKRAGRYHRIAGSEMLPTTNPKKQKIRNDESAWIVIEDTHEAIIDRKMFNAIQKKLTTRQKRTTSHKRKNGDGYVLSGLVFCANCGAKMFGTVKTRKTSVTTHRYHKYICSSYKTYGTGRCGCCSVHQDVLVAFLVRKLRDAVLAGGHREALRERVRERLEAREKVDPAELDGLRKRLAELEEEVKNGAKRLLRAPDDIADLLQAELSNLRRDKERVAAELQELERQEPIDIEAETDAVVDELWTMASDLETTDAPRLRELIRRMVARIDIEFGEVRKGKRIERPVTGGTVSLRPDPIFSDLYSSS